MRFPRREVTARELIDRGRQAASRWLERYGIGDVGEPKGLRLLADFAAEPFPGPVLQGPFFASFDDPHATRAALRYADPTYEEKLRARAERILAGRHDLLGFRDLSFGDPIDWRLDPTTQVTAPSRHWSRIDFLDPRVVGDHKVIWELGRHRSLLVLAQAWFCTLEERYAAACAAMIESFLDANPPKHSIHWASSLELAFRSITWVWVLALVGDHLSLHLRMRALGHLAVSARHIEKNLSRWFSPNTHLTGEALGLFVLGTTLPHLRGAERWKATGSEILIEWLGRHVRGDGTYVEQSTWYHRYTTDFYLHFFILSERASWKVGSGVAGPVERLLDTLKWLTRPDGTMPLIGDDDGGRLLFLDESTAHTTRAPLSVGATLFARCDFAAVAGGPTTELVWLLGPGGIRRFEAIPHETPSQSAKEFPDGGLHVIRSGWGPESSMLTVDAGPHGFLNGGHAHADALSIDLSLHGHPVFVDPGTFTYTVSQTGRDRFRKTSSHSAAVLDGRETAVPAGPFQWATQVTAHREGWHHSEVATLFVATHDGFGPPDQLRYVRVVAFVPPDLWIIRDEVHGVGRHELAVHWQCAPGIQVAHHQDGMTIHLEGRDVRMCVVEPGGEWSVMKGNVSPTYGVLLDASHLQYRFRGTAPFTVTTVITDDVASVTPVGSRLPGGAQVSWGERTGVLVTAGCSPPDWLETDAAVAWIERDRSSNVEQVAAANVSRMTVSGTRIVDAQHRLAGFSAPGGARDRETGTGN